MNNSLVQFKYQPPTAFGTNDEINAIIERMAALIPVRLDDYQLGQPDIVRNLNDSYLKAAQLSLFYRLIPGVDVHIIPFGRGFAVDTGVEAWKKAADRYCSLHGISYHAVYEEMTRDQLKTRRGGLYDPDDVGFICFLWRSDKEAVYNLFGGKDAITKGYGHWAKKARPEKKGSPNFKPDEIPAQRTKADVARRRALKAALKNEFSLDSLLAAAPNELREQLTWLDKDANRVVSDAQVMQKPVVNYTPDGFPEEEQPSQDPEIVEGSWREDEDFYGDENDPGVEADEGMLEEEPLDEEALGSHDDPEVIAEYRMIGEKLEGQALTMMNWAKQYHADSNGPAKLIEYRILVGEIDKLIGKYHHTLLLGVLLGRQVSSDNLPGEKFVSYLLHFLQEKLREVDEAGKSKKDAKGKVIYKTNAGYRESFGLAIKEAWRQINELEPKNS